MAERTRVNLTVHPEQKEKWQRAVEQNADYNSLSDLIRLSVARELDDTTNAANAPEGRAPRQTEAQTQALEQVTDTLARMEDAISDVEVRLANVEQEVTATGRAGIKNRVFDALPAPDGGPAKSAEDVADELGEDIDKIRDILGNLETEARMVQTVTEIDGEAYYTQEDR